MRKLYLALLMAALALPAYAQSTPTTYVVKDGAGSTQNFRADQLPDRSLATHSVPEVGGNAVGATNPMPVASAKSSGVPTGLIQSDASAPINVTTAATTQVVALTAGQRIYVTSFNVIVGGTSNITFVYGTGTNCGTGTTSMTGPYNLVAQAGIAIGAGIGPVLVVPPGNALCVQSSSAVQVSGSVSFTKF